MMSAPKFLKGSPMERRLGGREEGASTRKHGPRGRLRSSAHADREPGRHGNTVPPFENGPRWSLRLEPRSRVVAVPS